MSLALIDTSTWARIDQDDVAALVAEAVEGAAAALVAPITLELLRCARSAEELADLAESYDALHLIEITGAVCARAREVQAELAQRGYHRGPAPVDLLAAAAVESVAAEVWHCDKHFELIASVTGQPVRRVGK